MHAVILLRFVATGNTGPTGTTFSIVYRNLPAAKARQGVPDQVLLMRRMGIMARFTGTSTTGYHEVDIVQILVTITKFSVSSGNLLGRQSLIVAVKTEGISLHGKGKIELFGVGTLQYLAVPAPMHRVTGKTIARIHRLVNSTPPCHVGVVTLIT
jgi:hypothetical protein